MNYKRVIESYLETTEKEDPEELSKILEEKPSSEIFINIRNYRYIGNLFIKDMIHNNRSVRT